MREQKVLIGIPAHNEEQNIGKLLNKLVMEYPTYDIIVISSGSKDKTDEIVRKISLTYRNVSLFLESERTGKASALDILLKELNKSYDVLVYMGADNMPEKGAIERLLNRLASSNEIGAVGSRPVPVNDPKKLCGWISHLIWGVHHEICLHEPKMSGELCALKSGIVYDVPPTIINDDAYLQFVVMMRGYKVAYEPDAIVYLWGPTNLKDLFKQRYRVTLGHYQVEQLLGSKLSTTYARRNVRVAWRKWEKVGFLKEILWFTFFIVFSIAVLLKAWFDFYIRRKLPYKWEVVKSTKKILENESNSEDIET
jgi:cellulose synthase/poly-beta-1,6-N-acetylglucosamine synthase-like glycosyltransferase